MKLKLPKINASPVKDTFITSAYFSKLKKLYKIKEEPLLTEVKPDTKPEVEFDYEKKLEEKKNQLVNKRNLSDLYSSNFMSVFEKLKKEFKESKKTQVEPEKKEENEQKESISNIKEGFDEFNKTKYVNPHGFLEFYKKYSKYDNLHRKYVLKNRTPSWSFIESSNEEKIIPNPLGLLRRSGQEKRLAISNHKVGDNYMKALSNSLRYCNHLKKLELSGNRIGSLGLSKLFGSINTNRDLLYNIREINLSENKIGSNDIDELIKFINEPKCSLENLNIFGNYLGDKNTIKLCEAITSNIYYQISFFNLGKNNIHDESTNALCKIIKECLNLRVLNLSHNWIHNFQASKLIKELIINNEIKVFDLSWNALGDELITPPTYEQLVNKEINHPDRLFNNFSLNEALYTGKLNLRINPLLPKLYTNNISKDNNNDNKIVLKTEGNAQVYKEPKKIKEKEKDPSSFALALGELFETKQISLIHLDISHNNLNFPDCKLISEKSKLNHSILGIHLEGNLMDINCLGFIIPKEKEKKHREKNYFPKSHIFYEMDKDYDLRKTRIDQVRKIRGKSNCWICEGFREVQFEFIPEEPILDPNNHLVKIHLDFDDYKPFDMIYNGSKYQIIRMCPPGEVKYFFTIDTKPVEKENSKGTNKFYEIKNKHEYIKYVFDEEYMEELNNIREKLLFEQVKEEDSEYTESENHKKIEKLNLGEMSEEDNINDEEEDQDVMNIAMLPEKKISIVVKTISKITVKINKNVIDEEYRKMISFCEPRPEKILNKFVKPRTPWTFPISIWAYYDYEYNDVPESYLDACFEFDFNRCQFHKEFKDDELYNNLRSFLRERYRYIIDCYKYYASLSGYQVWQITQNSLSDFIYKCPGLCDKKYDINNVYLQQKVVIGNLLDKEDRKKRNKNLSENNVVRHQFMNLLVKTARDKYITVLKQTDNLFEAVKMAFEQHYDPVLKGFEFHQWRKERYYNEQVDNFMKTFLPLLDALYLSWAKQKGPTKKDIWMVLDEFNSLIPNIVDIDEYSIRDNPFIFCQSIKLQVNEIYTDKHLNMMLPEFLEALSRTIDKASPFPPNESKEDWPMEKRKAQPLIKKLENVLPILIKLITNPEFKNVKEKFPMPLKDLVTGLYIPNYDNPFYLGYVIKPGVKKGNMRGRASIFGLNPNDNMVRRRSSKLNSGIRNKILGINENNKTEEKPKINLELNTNDKGGTNGENK